MAAVGVKQDTTPGISLDGAKVLNYGSLVAFFRVEDDLFLCQILAEDLRMGGIALEEEPWSVCWPGDGGRSRVDVARTQFRAPYAYCR